MGTKAWRTRAWKHTRESQSGHTLYRLSIMIMWRRVDCFMRNWTKSTTPCMWPAITYQSTSMSPDYPAWSVKMSSRWSINGNCGKHTYSLTASHKRALQNPKTHFRVIGEIMSPLFNIAHARGPGDFSWTSTYLVTYTYSIQSTSDSFTCNTLGTPKTAQRLNAPIHLAVIVITQSFFFAFGDSCLQVLSIICR